VASLTAYGGAGHDDAGLLLGSIALGADDELSPEAREAFRASGLAHLLAVSGGNVALLVAAVLVLVWVGGGTRVGGHVCALVAVVGYVGLVGPSPSVVRAGVAGVLASAAWLLSRPSDPWHLYAAGLAVLLCVNPYDLLDPGFQLSFAAVAAIILVAPRLREALEGLPFIPGLRAATAISAACTLATAPIGWWHFGRLNLIAAVPANLLALPAVPALLWIGLASGMVAPFAPSAAAALASTGRLPGEYLLGVARLGAAVDARTQPYEAPLAAALAALLLCALVAWGRRSGRWWRQLGRLPLERDHATADPGAGRAATVLVPHGHPHELAVHDGAVARRPVDLARVDELIAGDDLGDRHIELHVDSRSKD
jgi:competence protein ComEC